MHANYSIFIAGTDKVDWDCSAPSVAMDGSPHETVGCVWSASRGWTQVEWLLGEARVTLRDNQMCLECEGLDPGKIAV